MFHPASCLVNAVFFVQLQAIPNTCEANVWVLLGVIEVLQIANTDQTMHHCWQYAHFFSNVLRWCFIVSFQDVNHFADPCHPSFFNYCFLCVLFHFVTPSLVHWYSVILTSRLAT